MNVLQTLTLRQIKGNPGRFRVTVLGVALATAMVTAVLLGADSALAALYGAAALANGSWHWTAAGPASVVQPLLEEEIFTDAALAVRLSQNSAPGAPIPVQRTGLYTRGEQAWGMLALELADGAVPAAEHDLLIDQNLAAAGPYAVGDSIALTDAGTGAGTTWTVCGIFHRFMPCRRGMRFITPSARWTKARCRRCRNRAGPTSTRICVTLAPPRRSASGSSKGR